jgi:hypothetical protein
MTDLTPEASPLPQRRPTADAGANGSGLPQRRPGSGGSSAAEPGTGGSLPRRTSASRRVGRHRSLHRLSVASASPSLVLAVPGDGSDADAELAEHIAESTAESCPGVGIRIGYLSADGDENLVAVLGSEPGHGDEHGPYAVVVPLLAGPHPVYDPAIAEAVSQSPHPVMLATALGPHPLMAGALHDRLSEVGLARASRARGLNIASGANGVIVVADRGPQAVIDAGVTTVLLAARIAIPAVPASFGDPVSIEAALTRLREAGASHPAIAPCVIGPELDPSEFVQLSEELQAPCAAPLGGHPAIAQLVAVRYGEALARISVASR